MPSVDFEPTILAFERAKTAHALDRAATVIGFIVVIPHLNTAATLTERTKHNNLLSDSVARIYES
jgi:hypothetical protein